MTPAGSALRRAKGYAERHGYHLQVPPNVSNSTPAVLVLGWLGSEYPIVLAHSRVLSKVWNTNRPPFPLLKHRDIRSSLGAFKYITYFTSWCVQEGYIVLTAVCPVDILLGPTKQERIAWADQVMHIMSTLCIQQRRRWTAWLFSNGGALPWYHMMRFKVIVSASCWLSLQ